MVERELCFTYDARKWGLGVGGRADTYPKANSTPDNQGARAFIDRGGRLHIETAQSALMLILKLVISGLTNVVLIVLSTVNHSFQGQSISIS